MMIACAALFALVAAVVDASSSQRVINRNSGGLSLKSDAGKHLMHHARKLNNNNNNQDLDLSFLSDYSVKFQGCHHVQQWNNNANDENDVRIKTKRLVRFRLCPSGDCASGDSAGCSTKYGDYVVDMNTFVEAFLTAKANDDGSMCQQADTECETMCDGDAECVEQCYRELGLYSCLQDNGNRRRRRLENDFDPLDYAACAQADLGRRRLSNGKRALEDDEQYYIGPYCADQGGEIQLGLFTDDTCTTFAQNGDSTFYNAKGYSLPFSDSSLVTSLCLGCGSYNDNGEAQLNEMCEDIYYLSGKCETRMAIDYPNESSCSYIKGIKIIRQDGVIRTASSKKSKAAAACIGLFLTIAVLLAGYVYYLRTKLSRARVNLAAASQTLT